MHSKDKNADAVFSYLLEIKEEIEGATNTKINIDKTVDQVEKELKSKDQKHDKEYFSIFKKKLKTHAKKKKHHIEFLEEMMFVEGYLPTAADENSWFEAKYGKEKDDDNETRELPAQFCWGVTLCLAGAFLYLLPIPICKQIGYSAITAGIAACGNSVCTQVDEDKKKKKKDKN